MSYSDPAKAPTDDRVIEEGVGMVTSDSLAAESYNAGGGFEGVPQSVPSKSTTTNTTDTTGASILPPSADRSSRVDRDGAETEYTGPVRSSGVADAAASGASAPYNTSKGFVDSASVGTAPSYVDAVQNASAGSMPKGENLREGGFDSDAPNASFNSDIGGRSDPAKVAEDGFARANARADRGLGAGTGEDGGLQKGGQGGFEGLKPEEQA